MSLENHTFMEKYHNLPFLEKKILQILSISYAKLSQTQLLACLVALDIKTEDDKSFDSGTRNAMLKLLRSPLDALLSTDILHGKSRNALFINRDYIKDKGEKESLFQPVYGALLYPGPDQRGQ